MAFILAVETTKSRNIGPFIRNAVAFGAKFLAVVGSPVFSTHGAHGSKTKIEIRHYFTWSELALFLEEINLTPYVTYGIDCSPWSHQEDSASSTIAINKRSKQLSNEFFFNTISQSGGDSIAPILNMFVFVIGGSDEFSDELRVVCDRVVAINFPSSNPLLNSTLESQTQNDSCDHMGNCNAASYSDNPRLHPARLAYESTVGIVLHRFRSQQVIYQEILREQDANESAEVQALTTTAFHVGKFNVDPSIHHTHFIKSKFKIRKSNYVYDEADVLDSFGSLFVDSD